MRVSCTQSNHTEKGVVVVARSSYFRTHSVRKQDNRLVSFEELQASGQARGSSVDPSAVLLSAGALCSAIAELAVHCPGACSRKTDFSKRVRQIGSVSWRIEAGLWERFIGLAHALEALGGSPGEIVAFLAELLQKFPASEEKKRVLREVLNATFAKVQTANLQFAGVSPAVAQLTGANLEVGLHGFGVRFGESASPPPITAVEPVRVGEAIESKDSSGWGDLFTRLVRAAEGAAEGNVAGRLAGSLIGHPVAGQAIGTVVGGVAGALAEDPSVKRGESPTALADEEKKRQAEPSVVRAEP